MKVKNEPTGSNFARLTFSDADETIAVSIECTETQADHVAAAFGGWSYYRVYGIIRDAMGPGQEAAREVRAACDIMDYLEVGEVEMLRREAKAARSG